MTNPTQAQRSNRWDTLPDILREALFLDTNYDFIEKTCANEHLSEEKTNLVSKTMGLVLMGFLHPEDLAEELKEVVGIDIKTATTIADAINQRIFAPLRADIDKAYAPLQAPIAGPKILQDISAAPASPKPFIPSPSATTTMKAPAMPPPIPVPPQKAPLPQTGWSKIMPQINATPPMPTPRPPQNIGQQSVSVAPQAGPVMLHQDANLVPLQKSNDFRLTRPSETSQIKMGESKPQLPLRAAVLEVGSIPPSPTQDQTPISKVVHYTDFKTPISTPPPVAPSARNVVEITAAQPIVKPLIPPQPPMPRPPMTPPPIPKPPGK